MAFAPQDFDGKWQRLWNERKLFRAVEDPSKKKYYVLDMFPYPSAAGLHVGHALGYTATDIVARAKRMQGYAVLHPMGWDAFGLPAEQHAIDTGEHPRELTYRNIANYKRQLQCLGMAYDWDRELFTCDPEYYRWTQWIFRLLLEKGLAYQAEISVNWCPALRTVLANEEVVDGKSERGGHDVVRVPMRQWMLKITAYAERLLDGLDTIDWPESVKEIQRNWIGKSVGARIRFDIAGHPGKELEVFTTRPDTLFGVTFMVLAPDHPLVRAISTPAQWPAVEAFQKQTALRSDFERTEMNKDKNGVFTGAYALHPVTGAKVAIWVGDHVLANYGTGAVMAVPAHDDRDFEFARKYALPVQVVVASAALNQDGASLTEAFTGTGNLVNSQFLDGLAVSEAKEAICSWLKTHEKGTASTNYRFRDWLFSRQRYWGEPLPVLKGANGSVIRPLKDDELPLTLPEVQSYVPSAEGRSPLSNVTHWVEAGIENGQAVFRETDTMPGSAGSSWYFLRYCDPRNAGLPFAKEKAAYWMPVDLYVGGQEHAVGHLLYSRFWTKVLFDAGVSPVDEPFQKLVNQGMITRNGAKMSKSKGNGVSPDAVMDAYGADALRVYEMFMGPLTQTKEWVDTSLGGVHRYLSRVERHFRSEAGENLLNDTPPSKADVRLLHKTIKKITEDIANLSFNTSVAQLMIFLNGVAESGCRNRELMGAYLRVLCPFAPHLAEELWHSCVLGGTRDPAAPDYPFCSAASWPSFDPALCIDDEVVIGVQVNGKHRGEIRVAKDASQEVAVQAAMEQPGIVHFLEGKNLVRTIFVAGRILNFVVA